MIIRSIAVQGWKCFADRVHVGRFGDRINVVHGPNGVGKSTLFQALVRGFMDAHRVSGEDANAIRPWGRDLAPTVEIGFVHGGSEYRLKKRFLERQMAELERREGGAFVRLAEGEQADERARKFLKAAAPLKGLSHTRHWGIAQVLWTPQGELALTELSGDLEGDIRSMLGAQLSGPAGTQVEKRIEALFSLYFTAGGAVKKGQNAPELLRFEERQAALGEELRKAQERLQIYENAARRLEDLRAGQAQLRREAKNSEEALSAAEKRARDYATLKSERAQQAERVKAAEAHARELRRQIDLIASCAGELARAGQQKADLEGQLPGLTQQAEQMRRSATERLRELETARSGRQLVDASRAKAELARKHNEISSKIGAQRERSERIRTAASAVEAARSARAGVSGPDAAVLRQIRKAIKERDEAQLRLEASLIHVEFVSAENSSATLVAGEDPGRRPLTAGQAVQFKGSPEVVLDLDGVGRLRATGPKVDVEEDRKMRERAARRIEKLSESFGTADFDKLESLHQLVAALDGEVERKQALLDGALGSDSEEALTQELMGLARALAAIREQRPDWGQSPPDSDGLTEEASRIERRHRETVEAAESDWQTAESARMAAEGKESEAASALRQLGPQIEAHQERLGTLTSDGKSDPARIEALESAMLAFDAAALALGKLDLALAGFPGDPADEAIRLKRQLQAADEALSKSLAAEQREEGRLAELTLAGPYTEVTRVEEEIAGLALRIARDRLHLNSVRLLRQTIAECRAQEVAAVTGPVERLATATLQRIAGRRLGGIRFGDGFCPENMSPEQAKDPVLLSAVSGGEKEQVSLATRLALADLLARDERQTVVLDDVLLATDTGRLMRTLGVLEEAADKLQIIVLTCHPERYRALDDAQFLDLEEIVATRARATAV